VVEARDPRIWQRTAGKSVATTLATMAVIIAARIPAPA
jgi:hypothetical protein